MVTGGHGRLLVGPAAAGRRARPQPVAAAGLGSDGKACGLVGAIMT